MNRKLFLVALASLVTALGGCNRAADPRGDADSPAGAPMELDVRVGDITRGCYTTENLKAESFDLSIVQASVNRYNYNSVGVSYDASSGKWTPEQLLLFDKQEPSVSFFAVAPSQTVDFDILRTLEYRKAGDGFTLFSSEVAAVQTQDDRSSDLITSYALDCCHNNVVALPYKPVDNKIALRFQHALSRFIVTLTLGTEFNHDGVPEENPVTELTVGGSVRQYAYGWDGVSYWDGSSLYREGNTSWSRGDFILLEAVRDDANATASDITPYQTSWTYDSGDKNKSCVAVYECVFVPQAVQFTIKFKLGGKSYQYTMPSERNLTAPGQNYRLNLTVGNDEVVTDTEDIVATPWTDGGVTDLETD